MRENEESEKPDLDVLASSWGLTVSQEDARPEAGEPRLVLFRPRSAQGARLPAVYNVHAGGMITGNELTNIGAFLGWVSELGLALASVEYRRAPENPHPAPILDVYRGLVRLFRNADIWGIDRRRIVISGASAGGGLAASCALMARDAKSPPLAGQMLICPMLDDRGTTHSSIHHSGPDVWNRESNLTGWEALLGPRCGSPGVSPYAVPARAQDLGGLPPAFIDVGSADLFRDEAVNYASRIWKAGGVADLHVWAGGTHGFDFFAPEEQVSRQARTTRTSWLKRLLFL